MFIKRSLRFFEIINLNGGEESIGQTSRKVQKNIHVVFSKEYYYRFEKIKEITEFTDYTEYAKQIKQGIKSDDQLKLTPFPMFGSIIIID